MKRVITAFAIAVIALLIFSYLALLISIYLFPNMSDQYFDPLFSRSEKRTILYFVHPFIIALALKYFWQRFKDLFKGNFLLRGLEVGLVYGLIAVIPAMWITFSGISVSLFIIISWIVYGFLAGLHCRHYLCEIQPVTAYALQKKRHPAGDAFFGG
ncbi:MAG: hypothetical protein R2794_03325 [Chitinophagales bacterium]